MTIEVIRNGKGRQKLPYTSKRMYRYDCDYCGAIFKATLDECDTVDNLHGFRQIQCVECGIPIKKFVNRRY